MMLRIPVLASIVLCGLLVGCDTVTPVDDSQLVVEGFINSGRPLPDIRIGRTLSPSGAYDADEAAVRDASVELVLNGSSIRYVPESGRAGIYRPEGADETHPEAGHTFSFRAVWNGRVAQASGRVPPALEILDVALTIPDEPVSAVLLDSLALADSLTTGLYTGFIYPIEVTVGWEHAEQTGWPSDASWIRAQLQPFSTFSSPVVDLFLRSEDIFREAEQNVANGRRTWTGIYAVGVADAGDRLPVHRLRIGMVRSGPEYAQFAASKGTPERREPLTNVNGAVGIVAAISVDSTHVDVTPGGGSTLPHRRP